MSYPRLVRSCRRHPPLACGRTRAVRNKGARYDGQRGTLLVEALVCFAIFLVASLVFYGLVATTHRSDAKARQILAANHYARQLLESAQAQGYSSLKVGTTTGQRDVSQIGRDTAGLTRLRSEVRVSDGPGLGVKTVLVTITWAGGRLTMESYVVE